MEGVQIGREERSLPLFRDSITSTENPRNLQTTSTANTWGQQVPGEKIYIQKSMVSLQAVSPCKATVPLTIAQKN